MARHRYTHEGRGPDGRKRMGRRLAFLEPIDLPTGRRNADGTLVLGPDGRPEVRRVERRQAIVEALSVGCTHKAACEAVGITDAAFYQWMAQGRADAESNPPVDGVFTDFFTAVTRACARAESAIVADIRKIARDKGDARTLLEMLGRRWPERWGRVERVELTGAEGDPLVPDHVAERTIMEAAREVQERRKAGRKRRQRGGDLPEPGAGPNGDGGNGAKKPDGT